MRALERNSFYLKNVSAFRGLPTAFEKRAFPIMKRAFMKSILGKRICVLLSLMLKCFSFRPNYTNLNDYNPIQEGLPYKPGERSF